MGAYTASTITPRRVFTHRGVHVNTVEAMSVRHAVPLNEDAD